MDRGIPSLLSSRRSCFRYMPASFATSVCVLITRSHSVLRTGAYLTFPSVMLLLLRTHRGVCSILEEFGTELSWYLHIKPSPLDSTSCSVGTPSTLRWLPIGQLTQLSPCGRCLSSLAREHLNLNVGRCL